MIHLLLITDNSSTPLDKDIARLYHIYYETLKNMEIATCVSTSKMTSLLISMPPGMA